MTMKQMNDCFSIRLEELSIGYGRRIVAENISEEIRQGELTCLLGPNGVGKSTMMRTLCGFQPAIRGRVMIGRKALDDYSRTELSKTVGVVLTERIDAANLTIEQIVALGRSPYTGFWGSCSDSDKQTVREALELVGIMPLANRKVGTLSDGERQKTMIAKALAQQTQVIFLDEPTAFLDYQSKVDMMILLKRISKEMKKVVFMSTHDVELAMQIADTLWLMEKGAITTGTPKELADKGEINRFFDTDFLKFEQGRLRIEI